MQAKEGQKNFYKKLIKLDPKIRNKFDSNDSQRSIRAFEIKSFTKISMYDWINQTKSEFNDNEFLKLYVDLKREDLINKISLRTIKMVEEGAIKEVKKFIKLQVPKNKSANKAIGIKEIKDFINNQIQLDEVIERISIKTRQYAKRQSTWGRGNMLDWKKIRPNNLNNFIKKI